MSSSESACFLPPLPTKRPSPTPLSKCIRRNTAQQPPARKPASITSNWQQQIFPEQTANAILHNLQSAPTTSVTSLSLHTLTNTHLYAIQPASDQALPLPLQSEQQRNLLLDTLSLTHFIEPQTPAPPTSAALITSVVPASLRRFLGLDNATCNQLAQLVVRQGRVNRATVLRETLRACGVNCVATQVRDAPSLGDTLSLEGVAFLAWADDANHVMEVQLSAPIAVALAALSKTPCYVHHDILHKAAHPLDSIARLDTAPVSQAPNECESPPAKLPTVNAWQLLAEDVQNLQAPQLLNLLRQCGIPTRSNQSREQLLRALLDHMCEVQRRELLIAIAAERGRYDWAAQLQAQRSERGRLWSEMRQLEKEARYTDALRLAERLRRLEDNVHDVTQDADTYDRDLDRDEWYRPVR